MTVRGWLWVGLAVLGAANLVVGAAWLGRDGLVSARWLSKPTPVRIDLPAQTLPPVVHADSAVAQSATPAAPPEPRSQPPTAQRRTCVALGPFDTLEEVNAIGQRIVSAGGEAAVVEEAEAGEPDYFVYVEPAASRALAHRTWRELVAQGIDAFVIPRGERENGVSVGVFSRRELAEAQHDRVSELGFSVITRTVLRSHVRYRLQAWDAPDEAVAEMASSPCAPPEPAADSRASNGRSVPAGTAADIAADQPDP
ncbi:MAG: hypothetical protein OXH15_09880 [Gammaproteobacteria bacterium]|nr:hypothetical protein [Gammaproteobacteria bacterium]